MNTKLIAGISAALLLASIASFVLDNSAYAQTGSSHEKAKTKVQIQKENRTHDLAKIAEQHKQNLHNFKQSTRK